MKKLLTRDEQIDLMKTVEQRHDALFARVLADPLVKEVVSTPVPRQLASAYIRTDRMVKCG